MYSVIKTEDITKEGFIIRNVPYNEYDYPCQCGCGEPMKSRSTAVIIRVIFLVKKYMIEKNLAEFDYNEITLIDEEFKKYWYEDRKKQKNNKKTKPTKGVVIDGRRSMV